MSVRRLLVAGIAAVILVLPATPALRGFAASPTSNKMKWLLNGPALPVLANDATARRFLENAQPFVMQRTGDLSVPASWNALRIISFTSYSNLKRAFESNSVDSSVRGILYDNEAWEFTPPAEQQDPATFMRMAAEVVHEHHLLFIAAPAVNITKALAPGREKRYDAYLRLNLAADSARYADVFNIQAQGSERNVELYSSFVRQAASQARAANAKVVVLAGLSTNPSGQHVTSGDILNAIVATRSVVDGYWFNIPKPSAYCPGCNDFRPDIAIDVFKKLGSAKP